MLGLQSCSESQWRRIVQWLEGHVTQLAQWSCEQARELVRQRGDKESWVASYDGFYLTREHYSNNSSATLHDFATGNITWFRHRTKRGDGHNWEGTSCGAENDMLDDILTEVKETGFTISEMVTDKDSSVNSYCQHFRGNNHLLQQPLRKDKQLGVIVQSCLVVYLTFSVELWVYQVHHQQL